MRFSYKKSIEMFGLSDQTISKIIQILKKHKNIKEVILFGSRAKGNYKNGSDIDLAIVSDQIDFDNLLKVSTELDALDLPYKIDVIDYNTITNEELKKHIERVGVSLFKIDIQ